MRRLLPLIVLIALAACATRPPPSGVTTPTIAFELRPARFQDLPGWGSADLAPALSAFRRSCDGRRQREASAALVGGGRYGGTVGDWTGACSAAEGVVPGAERAFFEANFRPFEVRGQGEARLTAYYEPIIEARRTPDPVYSAPLLLKPSDLVTVNLAAFAEAYDDETLRGAPRRLTGQIVGTEVRPYPSRSEIAQQPGQAFAYAHPVDVYNMQVQGSGRLQFPDGRQARASFAAQNGYRWHSALGALRDSGAIPAATWANFKSWSDAQGPEATRAALNADPSYVFFNEEPIDDPTAGPRGASGVSLTPMGSLAVDPSYHPYGAVIFVDGVYDDAPFQRLFVAQDTGGAIRRGPLRGDVFFGTGPDAASRAERMNGPARWWTLLPNGVPIS